MEDEIVNLFGTSSVVVNSHIASDLNVNVVLSKVEVDKLDKVMDMGWVIMASWIDDTVMDMHTETFVTDISFRLGKDTRRIIMTTDVPLAVPWDTIPNIDADDPGSMPEITTGMRTKVSKLRAAAISGYGPYAPRGPGIKAPVRVPKLSILGLDIEVTTVLRTPGMPLPEDEMMTVAITNGGWYDKTFGDKCLCLHTFGNVGEVEWDEGRTGVVVKVNGSAQAVRVVYETITSMCPDFVNIHNGFNFDLPAIACWSVFDPEIEPTFEQKRLGNVGDGTMWNLTNGTMVVDSMYSTDKTARRKWKSLSLRALGEKGDLPPKLDVSAMDVVVAERADLTTMIKYNARDADLHAWVARTTGMCERICTKAGVSRSTIMDSIVDNTGVMGFCVIQSEALSRGTVLDLARNTSLTDDMRIEGGHVVDPRPGCYKGVIVIDANSLYPSLMKHLQIFIDRCVSARAPAVLFEKLGVPMPTYVKEMPVGEVVAYEKLIVMRTMTRYIAVVQGEQTIVGDIVTMLISMRKEAIAKGDDVAAGEYKFLVNAIYGSMASRHGILSSKTCAEATTCAARYFLKIMIGAVESTGATVIYGDTDSVMAEVGGSNEQECLDAGEKMREAVAMAAKGTPFANIGIGIDGSYKVFMITAKKKYAAMKWNGEMETKGMAPVKKDVIPIAREAASKVLNIVMQPGPYEDRKAKVCMYIGGLAKAIEKGLIPMGMQVAEKKVNCQPHYAYTKTSGEKTTVLVDMGAKITDVSKKWVMERVSGSIKTILEAADMPSVQSLIFAYNMIARQKRS